jgi:hypothetical protein
MFSFQWPRLLRNESAFTNKTTSWPLDVKIEWRQRLEEGDCNVKCRCQAFVKGTMRWCVYSMNEHVILLRLRATLVYKGGAGGPDFAYPNVPKFLTPLSSRSLRCLFSNKLNLTFIITGYTQIAMPGNTHTHIYLVVNRGLRFPYKTGFGLDDWIYWFVIHTSRDYRQYSTIAISTLFTVHRYRSFRVFILHQSYPGNRSTRITVCHFKSQTKSSLHRLILSLPFLLNHLGLTSPELDPILDNNSLKLTLLQLNSLNFWQKISQTTFLPLYKLSARTTQKTQRLCCWQGLFPDPLPSNWRLIVARVRFRGDVFTESLPSNGSICHNIYIRLENRIRFLVKSNFPLYTAVRMDSEPNPDSW